MQRLIPIIAYLLFTFSVVGQPIITSEVLPRIGDTILMASDNLPENIAILGKGENQNWDLMRLQSAFTQKIAIKKATGNAPFAKKDVLMQEMNGINNFFKSDGHSLEQLGSIGLDPMNMGVQTTTYYDKPIQTLHFPLKYGMTSEQTGSFSFKVAVEDLPKAILYTLPITPDSVRYRCLVNQQKEIDAWGILSLPDNTYEVLREKNVEERSCRIDIKVGNLPWQDITEGVDDPNMQVPQISLSYHFYSNETTSKVAAAYMKPNGVNPEVVYYTVSDPNSTIRITNGRPDIYAYPNPAINDVRFEFSNLKPSEYSLRIYNILGVVVMEEKYPLNGFKTKKLDVSKLRKGTYLYSLSDAKGKTIATRRLMVIRP
ncbi:MAG: T9SS type A sorting domain-containing protein [Saprospiraceae bacterium]